MTDMKRYGSQSLPFKETFLNNRGLNQFTEQMRTAVFDDILFGKVYPHLLEEANQFLKNNHLSPYSSDRLRAIKPVMEHIYKGRIVENGAPPEFVRGVLKKSLFNPNSVVSEGNYLNAQAITSNIGETAGRAFIAPHSQTGEPLLKTIYSVRKGRY